MEKMNPIPVHYISTGEVFKIAFFVLLLVYFVFAIVFVFQGKIKTNKWIRYVFLMYTLLLAAMTCFGFFGW